MTIPCRVLISAIFIACSAIAAEAHAARLNLSGSDAADRGIAETAVPGPLAAGGAIGASLTDFGIDFSYGHSEGYYSDIDPNPLNSGSIYPFCGVNSSGACDLFTEIGRAHV